MSSPSWDRGLEWYVARRYMASRRGGRLFSFITWIALGGVTVGVSALVVVIGVMTGMQEDLLGKILESSPHVLVLQQGVSLRMDDWETTADRIRQIEGVDAVAPFVLTQVSVLRGNYSQPADMYGVALDPGGPPVTEMEAQIQEGAHDLSPTASGLPPGLMGSRLAASQGWTRHSRWWRKRCPRPLPRWRPKSRRAPTTSDRQARGSRPS